jgi:hypothetical protein
MLNPIASRLFRSVRHGAGRAELICHCSLVHFKSAYVMHVSIMLYRSAIVKHIIERFIDRIQG